MTKCLRNFRPALVGLETRVVPSGAAATAATVSAAGDPAANEAALSAFAGELQEGRTPTLTVDFGTPIASQPAGTVVIPLAAYSSSLGYGWLSNPSKLQIQNGAVSGRSGDFEIDVPPGIYDITIAPATSSNISAGSQVTGFAAANTLGGPGAFFADNGPAKPVTLRTPVLQGGAGNGLIIAMDRGFAVQSVQITPVDVAGASGLFTPAQTAPTIGMPLNISGASGHPSIGGTAHSSVLIPESGTITWDPKNGGAEIESAESQSNWYLLFRQPVQGGAANIPSTASVTGDINAMSNTSQRSTSGTLAIHTPEGRINLSVKGQANTAVPFDDLSSSVPLTYTVRGGTGVFRHAKGSGAVELNMTLTEQSVEGIVTGGVLDPSIALGTITLTFQPGTNPAERLS
jgi:hypothetical protein